MVGVEGDFLRSFISSLLTRRWMSASSFAIACTSYTKDPSSTTAFVLRPDFVTEVITILGTGDAVFVGRRCRRRLLVGVVQEAADAGVALVAGFRGVRREYTLMSASESDCRRGAALKARISCASREPATPSE